MTRGGTERSAARAVEQDAAPPPSPAAPSRHAARRLKYAADRVLAAVAALVTAPLFLVVAIVLLACGVRSALTIERRVGDRSTFPLARFEVPPELRGRLIGRVLVGSGLIALPQVFSVLRGDMSLIGPSPRREGEPPPPARPGLVGLAQNAQAHGPITPSEQFALDAQYAREWSLGLDARILATCVRHAFLPPH